MKTQRIYLSLDSILDTRLATIEMMNPDAAVKLLESGWRKRNNDNYFQLTKGVIRNEEFYENYAKRDVETLKMARVSSIGPLLHQIASGLEAISAQDPEIKEIVVELNCWPYKLTPELKEIFGTAVGAYTSLSTRVEPVDVPPECLTPKYFKDSYSTVILYDFNQWQGKFANEIIEHKMPDVTIIAPMLFHTRIPTDEELMDKDGNIMNPWAAAEAMYIECFQLVLCEAAFFSIVDL